MTFRSDKNYGRLNQFPEIVLDSCPLCGSAGPLRESHIIPRFVFDWMLQSSPTGFLRFGTVPNVRVKDGMKSGLLCDACESQLSYVEKLAAERLFLPYHNGACLRVRYESWLAKFCASVVWRVLFVFTEIDPLEHLTTNQKKNVSKALKVWKNLIFNAAEHPGPFELHILPVDKLDKAEGFSNLPPNISRYLARAVDIDVAASPNSAFVYAKMCRLIVLGFIERPQFRRFHGSRIAMKQGVIEPRNFMLPMPFANYLTEKARGMAELGARISARQQAKIDTAMRRNPDRAAQSDGFAALLQDVTMFGRSAFRLDDD